MDQAFRAMDAALSELGCRIRWSNHYRICFNVRDANGNDGACHWAYDGIELSLFSFRQPSEALTAAKLRAELAQAEAAIQAARRAGAKVAPPPAEAPAPAPAPKRPPSNDPFAHIDDDLPSSSSIFGGGS